jgi:membrane-bound lytic murein transglycosylase
LRGDLFRGAGEAAGEAAGLMRERGSLWLLSPRGMR